MRVLLVDDSTGELYDQWARSGCADTHTLLVLLPSTAVAVTVEAIRHMAADVVVIGHWLGMTGTPTGSDVIRALRASGWTGYVVANSGGGRQLFDKDGVTVDASADRDPGKLRDSLTYLMQKETE